MKNYWITWSYKDSQHTPGSDCYHTEDQRRKILDNPNFWRANCYPSATFETDVKTGDVI